MMCGVEVEIQLEKACSCLLYTSIGSAASGEGLVNVYRGTGKVLMMPTANLPNI